MVYHMTKIGEDTGSVESMYDKVAEYYEEEVEIAVSQAVAFLEPCMIIILGIIIGYVPWHSYSYVFHVWSHRLDRKRKKCNIA